MGVVYRGTDRLTENPVAIKVLHRGTVREHRRFAREAALLAELRHPGIVQYLDHGSLETGAHYLIMEWVEGSSLADRLRQGRLSMSDTLALGARVADALGAAHRIGVVHRDVKPGNILLPGDSLSDAKLLDFGIARRLVETRSLTATGSILGTLLYMAPEQARDARQVDARTDVYSLGVTLFECITGQRVFDADDPSSALAELIFGETPRLRDRISAVPHPIDELVARMMDRDPSARPADGEAAYQALDALRDLDDLPQSSELTSLTARERRLVTVLLVDSRARGGTAPSGEAPPDEALTLVRDDTPTRAIPRASGLGENASDPDEQDPLDAVAGWYGGAVQRLPDGIVRITFSDSSAGWEEHERAALCALACRTRFGEARLALGAAAAVTTTDEGMADVTALARHALAQAEPGTIRVAPRAAAIVQRRFRMSFDEHGGALMGQRAAELTTESLLGQSPPCVGRQRELDLLEGTLEEAATEPVARAVLVTGKAGVGKSRLLREFLERAARQLEGLRVLVGRADWIAAGSPFSILGSVLRTTASIDEGDEPELAQRKLVTRVADSGLSDEQQSATAPFLGELARVPFTGEVSAALQAAREDAVIMGDHMRAAWEDFLGAECQRAPVVLVLENIQWADGPSLALVDGALRHLADQPFMVVATARPEARDQFPNLWAERDVHEMRLAPLTKKASELLLVSLVGEELPQAELQALAKRSGGNPLYIEELGRAITQGEEAALPDSLKGILQTRLNALSTESRRLLRAAAVFGQAFWAEGAAVLLGMQGQVDRIESWLDPLERAGIVLRSRSSSLPGHRQYRFEHDLLRAAAYDMLPDDDRALGHRLAGQWLESAGENNPAVLASHYARGRAPERALPWFAQAARQALEASELGEAKTRADEALRCAPDAQMSGELHLIKAEAHRLIGEFAEAVAAGRQALSALPPGEAKWYRAAHNTAAASFHLHQPEVACELATEVEQVEPHQDARAAKVTALCLIGWFIHQAGEEAAATAAIEHAERLVASHRIEAPAAIAWLHAVRAMRAYYRGDLAGYLTDSERAVERLDAAGDLRGGAHQRANVAVGYANIGQYERAVDALCKVHDDAERIGLRKLVASAQLQLSQAHYELGGLEQAVEAAQRCVEVATQIGSRRLEGAALGVLGMVACKRGHLAEAEQNLHRAVELLEKDPSYRADALVCLARVRLQQQRSQDALDLVDQTLQIGQKVGGLGGTAFTLAEVQFEALRQAGRSQEAARVVQAAALRLHEEAARFSDDAVRQGFLQAVPGHARILELAGDHSPSR